MLTVLWQTKSTVSFSLKDEHVVNGHHVVLKSHDATQKKCPHLVHFNGPRDGFETNSRHQKRYFEGGPKSWVSQSIDTNRPFPSSLVPLFQNLSKCENEFRMQFHFHANESNFHKNGFALIPRSHQSLNMFKSCLVKHGLKLFSL